MDKHKRSTNKKKVEYNDEFSPARWKTHVNGEWGLQVKNSECGIILLYSLELTQLHQPT